MRSCRFIFCLTFFLVMNLFSSGQTIISLNNNWQFREAGKGEWLPATVPGTVHTDLLNNHIIPNPLIFTNEDSVQWIENCDWEYSCNFSFDKRTQNFKHIQLVCHGLDTYADIFLNGKFLLHADNMFREWSIDLNVDSLQPQNELRIVFYSAVNRSHELAKQIPYILPGGDYVFVRKAPYQFGWDWGPRLVTCGIGQPIELKCWDDWQLSDVHFTQYKLTDAMAWMRCDYNLQTDSTKNYLIKIVDANTHQLYTQAMMFHQSSSSSHLDFYIMNPKRWWPNEYGNQNIYQLAVQVYDLDDTSKLFCADTTSVGLRAIQLIQQPDSVGSSFYFLVNGIPIYAKGANWIPPSNFLPLVTDSVYASLIHDAVVAHMNMLRVWGGGVYANEKFLKLCDENGIMVWQDFMFAGAMYPGDSSFVNNVKAEIAQQVSRISQHPCLALWCGNNEVDEAWNNWGWQQQYQYSAIDSEKIYSDYKMLFDTIIPNIVDSLNGFGNYVASSPQIGWGHDEAMQQGDSHYWGVWWGNEPFNMYEKKVPRFMSEFGFQAFPHFQTINQSTTNLSDKWNNESLNILKDDGLMQHQKHPTGYQTIMQYTIKEFSPPKTLSEFAWKSNLLQANGIAEGIEAQRRAKPNCMGSLYWQLNDCWPVCSWSSVDVNGNYKALQYKLKTVFNPLMISICKQRNDLQVWVVNDLLKDTLITVSLFSNNLNGHLKTAMNKTFLMKANSSLMIYKRTIDPVNKIDERVEMIYEACLTQGDSIVQKTFYGDGPEKLFDLRYEKIDTSWSEVGDAYILRLHSKAFQYGIFLDDETNQLKMSNNYFNMDGVHDEVISFEKTIPLATLKKNLVIKSLNFE